MPWSRTLIRDPVGNAESCTDVGHCDFAGAGHRALGRTLAPEEDGALGASPVMTISRRVTLSDAATKYLPRGALYPRK